MGIRNIEPTQDEPEVPPDSRLIMWPLFLRISPSYMAAHNLRIGQASDLRIYDKYPAFDEVLKVYDLFGDVFNMPVKEWWKQNSVRLFSTGYAFPIVKYVGFARKNEEVSAREFSKGLRQCIDISRPNMDNPAMVILAIPIFEDKSRLLQTLGEAIDFYRDAHGPVDRPDKTPLYKLSAEGSGKLFNGLDQCLRLVHLRSKSPELELWELGYEMKIGRTARGIIDSIKANENEIEHAKKSLRQATSRIFNQALSVAEWAARGYFPRVDGSVVGSSVKFDYAAISEIIEERI